MDKLKYIKLENEDGSYSSSIPLAVDSNYVDVNGNTLTNELNNKASSSSINNLQSQINSLASGSPLVAASTSDMIDITKIYVNTTDGNWYYYNGSAWNAGGIYQATSNQNQINMLNNIIDDLGFIYNLELNGTNVTTPIYVEGGKSYKIRRISPSGTDVRGSIFVEGHSDVSIAIPYVGEVSTFSPVYSGFLRYYNATSSSDVTLTFEIIGIIDEIEENVEKVNNYVYGYDLTQTGQTTCYVNQGDLIKVKVNSNTVQSNMFVLPYVGGDTFLTIPTGSGVYYLTAPKSGYIGLQNTATEISAKIFVLSGIVNELDLKKEIYIVDKNGNGDYTSFTAMERDLKNNFEEKIVYVNNGVYNIYDELGGDEFIATITDPTNTNWRDVCEIVPPNTHIIGLGEVTLKFDPTDSQIGSNAMAFLFSPLNVSYSCTIENIRVYGRNCRYAIHDESSGYNTYNNTIHKYINVTAEKEHGTYGNAQCFGSGLARNCYWKFDGCTFKSDRAGIWTVHTTTSQATDVSKIFFNNCIFANYDESSFRNTDTIQFISGIAESHLSVKNIVNMNNCYITGKIGLTGDAGATQRYKLTTLKNTSNGIRIDENLASNPYVPEVYN